MLGEGLNPSYLLPRVILRARIYPAQSRVDIPSDGRRLRAPYRVVLQSKYKESGRISRNLVLMNRNVFAGLVLSRQQALRNLLGRYCK